MLTVTYLIAVVFLICDKNGLSSTAADGEGEEVEKIFTSQLKVMSFIID